jgi:hypothetical protein
MAVKESPEARRQKKLFETARRNLQRALPKAVKAVAKKSGWRTSQGVLFREAEGWFFEIGAIPWIAEAKTPANLHSKPMSLDPLFWKIVGLDENINQPLSFRAFGAFVCRTPPLREADMPEGSGDPEQIARALLEWANEQLSELRGTQSVEGFVDFIRFHPNQIARESHLPALVTAMLLQGKDEEALAICSEARDASPFGGGFLFMGQNGRTKSFLDLAIEWITNSRRSHPVN